MFAVAAREKRPPTEAASIQESAQLSRAFRIGGALWVVLMARKGPTRRSAVAPGEEQYGGWAPRRHHAGRRHCRQGPSCPRHSAIPLARGWSPCGKPVDNLGRQGGDGGGRASKNSSEAGAREPRWGFFDERLAMIQDFDRRTLAKMELALDRVCGNTPLGEQHDVRKRVVQGIVRCAKSGSTSLGALKEAGERS
jgi:hypothetical protein